MIYLMCPNVCTLWTYISALPSSPPGKLSIYMLHRKATLAKLKGEPGQVVGRPPEQDIPLKVRYFCKCGKSTMVPLSCCVGH